MFQRLKNPITVKRYHLIWYAKIQIFSNIDAEDEKKEKIAVTGGGSALRHELSSWLWRQCDRWRRTERGHRNDPGSTHGSAGPTLKI